ncbi:MAG: DUF2892 domain-containing protein [Acidobacteria bacterium]|jgi:hypothetical protein|nr:DUF2892 domain-containing protein [Acidobacteriota bacterium]
MSIDRIVHSAAGTMILASLALTRWVHPNFVWLTVFVGANLLQSGITNWCLLSRILRKLGVEDTGATCGL